VTEDQKNLERRFLLRSNEILLNRRGVTFEVVVASYRDLESEFLPLVGSEEMKIEMRRGVRQRILTTAISMEQPLERCEALLVDCDEIGWEELWHRGGPLLAFCRYAHDFGRTDVALEYLVPFMETLAREAENFAGPSRVMLEETVRPLFAEIAR
jgi:hypothetical protein